MEKKYTKIDFWFSVIVAFVLGIVATFVYNLIEDFNIEILFLCALSFTLSALLIVTLNMIRNLNFKLSQLNITSQSSEQQLLQEVMESLKKYGYTKTSEREQKILKTLSNVRYIRGQNIYYMMTNGILQVKSRVLFINDHPFKPFSDLINNNLPEGVEYKGVGAFPDEMYSKEDVNRRIEIIEEKNIEYYFLPDEDVHLSMVIFDENATIIYTTPKNKRVCNFSEGLLFTDKSAVKETLKIFNLIFSIAKKRYKGDINNVINELSNVSNFYTSPPDIN